MLSKTLLALCFLLALQAYGEAAWINANALTRGRTSRALLQSSASAASGASAESDAPQNRASASSRARSTSGRVRAISRATSAAFSYVRNEIKEQFDYAIKELEKGGDATAIAEICATATGFAIAEAYSSVAVEIISDSPNAQACGDGFSEADVTATAFAEVFVAVAAKASSPLSSSEADAEAYAISVGTASAFANASADACVYGVGFAEAEQKALASSLVEPYAEAYVRALANITDAQAVADSESTSDSSVVTQAEAGGSSTSVVGGQGNSQATGGSAANAEQVETECAGIPGMRFCCRLKREECRCAAQCKATKVQSVGETTTYRIVVKSRNGVVEEDYPCFC